MPSKSVFISHAAVNKELADKLVDLLETGIGISTSDVFCSSLEGMGVPGGTNFVEFIREQVKETKVVILLLTVDYYQSQFCLCELGASWVLSHKIIPLLVKPLDYKDIKAVLTGVHALKLEDKSDLNEMLEELKKILAIKGKPFARWEVKRDKFLEEFVEYVSKIEPPKVIRPEEYSKLERKYTEAVEELRRYEEEIEKKDVIIKKLKDAKSPEDADKILYESLSEVEKFEALLKEAKSALKKLPAIVKEALFYYFRKEAMEWPGFGEDYRRREIKDALENDYLQDDDGAISVVDDELVVSDAIGKLDALNSFICSEEPGSKIFQDNYEKEYGHRLLLTSKRFWETHLF